MGTRPFAASCHAGLTAQGLLKSTDITPGLTSDDLVMGDNVPAPRVLLADQGHDAARFRKSMSKRDGLAQTPAQDPNNARGRVMGFTGTAT